MEWMNLNEHGSSSANLWAEYISSNFGLQYDYTVFVITAFQGGEVNGKRNLRLLYSKWLRARRMGFHVAPMPFTLSVAHEHMDATGDVMKTVP